MRKMPVLLTFDVDGEMIWRCRDPENADRPVTLSLGHYGLDRGLPRILKVLKKYDAPATFFVPGMTAEMFPYTLTSILDEGIHEIGHHSYSHTYPDKFPSKEAEAEDYERASRIIEPVVGHKLKGYRSPAWEFSRNTLDILKDMGIEYSSNMMGTDCLQPLEIFGEKSDIIEVPIHWILDDAAFWLYSVRIQGKCMQPLSAVEDCWIKEFDGLYEEFMDEVDSGVDSDIVFVLICHPQIIGRPSRMMVLENVIKHIHSCPNVEFVTMGQAVADYKKRHGLA